MTAREYVKVLKPLLPAEVFVLSARRMWVIAVHLCIALAGVWSFRLTPGIVWPLLSLLVGHSLAVIAFHTHDISHGVPVKNRRLRVAIETILWALLCAPGTFWRQTHNRSHHHHASTPSDPDRPYLTSEKSWSTCWYVRLFYPSDSATHCRPLWFLHLAAYFFRQTLTALWPSDGKPTIATTNPNYTARQKLQIAGELVLIVATQFGWFLLAGGTVKAWLFASVLSLVVASTVLMWYIFTNHFLNPIQHGHDPVVGSTSVEVPRWLDWLHDNFSYHTEHHLFPHMDPVHYPTVSRLLKEHFPERYNRIPIGEAWRLLWQQPPFRPLLEARQPMKVTED